MLNQQILRFVIPVPRGFCLLLFCLLVGTFVSLGEAYRSGDVKLAGGADKYEGTVLVMSRGIWKSVCGLGWDVQDASVVCRQLGFRGIRRFFRWSKFGEGNTDRLRVKFSCRGNENNLIGCPRRLRRNTRLQELCNQKYRSAGVVCKADRTTTARPTTAARTTRVRTTTPKRTTTTSVPSTTRATTRKVASRGTSRTNSRHTSRPTSRYTSRPTSRYTSRPTSRSPSRSTSRANSRHTSRVTSRPTSRSPSRGTSHANSLHTSRPTSRPASRANSRPTSRPTSRTTHNYIKTNKISITDASAANRSRPEIKTKDELSTSNNLKGDKQDILKDEGTGTGSNSVGSLPANTDLKDAREKLSATTDHNEKKESIPSAGSSEAGDRVEEKKIKVKKPEKKKSMAHTDNSSDKKEQQGSEEQPETKKMSSVDQSKDKPVKEQKFKVSLSGGRSKREGHVAILLPGEKKWGAICGDQWTYFEGSVVCRQLGLGLLKQIYQVNYYGGTHLPKLYARFRCIGNESHLADCEKFEYVNQVKCSKAVSVAGVICTTKLPDLVPDAKALQESVRLEDRPLYYLTCAMEENCLADEAYEIKERSQAWITASRRLLRFSSIVYNKGTADFIPNAPKDAWEWHQCHMHYHSMEVFAHYDIIDMQGNRVAQGHKASFCLEDTRCPPGIAPKYNCLGFGDQGLSVNCSDNYYHDIDCQWIDITGIKYGNYILKVEFNPKMHVSEITFDNNVVECSLYYTGTYAYLQTCNIVPLRRSD